LIFYGHKKQFISIWYGVYILANNVSL